jgi:hypothetical protein
MEKILNIHIEKLPEGVYLATSDDVQGLARDEQPLKLLRLPVMLPAS